MNPTANQPVGITAYGLYIPWHRLNREEVARELQSAGRGEKAVASYDEDSLTLGVEAARNCLRTADRNETIDRVYFCSTTAPYAEKQSAVTLAEVCRLPETAMTVDIGNSLRAGTQGLIMASDSVAAGRTRTALVCASDTRLGLPSGDGELSFGDAAAAFCIGTEDVIAVMESYHTSREELLSNWRTAGDLFVRNYEERFGLEMGYKRSVPKTVKTALEREGLAPADISRVVLYGANPRHIKALVGKLGFDGKEQVQDTLFQSIGNPGSAQVPMNLIAALEGSRPGDRILAVGYGDGCDVILFRVTERIEDLRKGVRKPIAHFLNNRNALPYVRYMKWRGILPVEPPKRAQLETPSAAALWRDRRGLALVAGQCTNCGTVQYPAYGVCVECGQRGEMKPACLADRQGRVVTYSHDNLASSMDSPTTVAVVDFEEGGRLMCDVTDRRPEEIQVGMPVEMTFRLLRSAGGIHDYWWKCTPVR